jgi:hypothetical protein
VCFVCLVRVPTQFNNNSVSAWAVGNRVWVDRQPKAAQVAHGKPRHGVSRNGCGVNTDQAVFGLREGCPQDRKAGAIASAGAECFVEHRDRGGCLVELGVYAPIDKFAVVNGFLFVHDYPPRGILETFTGWEAPTVERAFPVR